MKELGNTASGRRIERFVTADGSASLRRDDGVTYRSVSGADLESEHTFIGPTHCEAPERRILELGFGAGTNFGNTVQQLLEQTLTYYAVEMDPIAPEMCAVVGPGADLAREALTRLQTQEIADVADAKLGVRLVVHRAHWQDANSWEPLNVDAVFHDPFSVDVNPDAWTEACFAWERTHMAPDALLATYGAATAIRRAMASAGLEVAIGKGAGRKREVTFAALDASRLARWKVITDKLLRQP